MYSNVEKHKLQHLKKSNATMKNIYCNNEKMCTTTLKNMYYNIEKTYTATLKKCVPQHQKIMLQHSKKCTAISQAIVLQHRKNICCNNPKKSHCNIQNHLLQHKKPLQHGEI